MFTEVGPHRFEPKGRGLFDRRRCRRCYLPKRKHPVRAHTVARPIERRRPWQCVFCIAVIGGALLFVAWWQGWIW